MRQTTEMAYKQNDGLLRQAKEVFGDDIITNAYVSFYHMAFVDDDYYINSLNRLHESYLYYQYKKNKINIGGHTIILEFFNGRKVCFDSSEWGEIINITDDITYEEVE